MYRIVGFNLDKALQNLKTLATGGMREFQHVQAEMPDRKGFCTALLVVSGIPHVLPDVIEIVGILEAFSPDKDGRKVLTITGIIAQFTQEGTYTVVSEEVKEPEAPPIPDSVSGVTRREAEATLNAYIKSLPVEYKRVLAHAYPQVVGTEPESKWQLVLAFDQRIDLACLPSQFEKIDLMHRYVEGD